MSGTGSGGTAGGQRRRPDANSFAAVEAMLLLGGNVGDPAWTLAEAERLLLPGAGRLLGRSRDHWTPPWGFTDARLFLNRALLVETPMSPEDLLAHCLAVETALGRQRGAERYGPRTIDIDMLWMDDLVRRTEAPLLPHPRLHERSFALAPAADLRPGHVHPVLERTILDLLNDAGQLHT